MKKLLLLFTAICFYMVSGHAQCTPDLANLHSGVLPDSATNLPHAMVGVSYSTVLQIYVPVDTIGTLHLDYDSVVITSFTGLPAGYTDACNPSTCKWLGSSHGCVLISGPAPPSAWANDTFYLSVTVVAYLHIHLTSIPVSSTQNVNYYRIIVDPNVGIESLSSTKFDVGQNQPNPFNRSTTIEFSTPVYDVFTLKVSNILGKIVYTKSISAQRGVNKIILSGKDFESGVYIYTLSNGRNAIARRMIIQNE
jgi:hypothetical protein